MNLSHYVLGRLCSESTASVFPSAALLVESLTAELIQTHERLKRINQIKYQIKSIFIVPHYTDSENELMKLQIIIFICQGFF